MAAKITFLTNFRLGVELVRDAVCFVGKLNDCSSLITEKDHLNS